MSFSIGKIPIKIQPAFFLLAGLLAIDRLAQPHLLLFWMAIVLLSVLVHELGHALAFRRLGFTPSIELHAMGGHTRTLITRPLPPKQDIMVALAGPFAGFALGGLVLLISTLFPSLGQSQTLRVVITDLLLVNFGWGLLNLLPILPMDGGRALLAGLKLKRPMRADELAHGVSVVVSALLAILCLTMGSMVGALLIGWFGYNNFQSYMRYREARDRWPRP